MADQYEKERSKIQKWIFEQDTISMLIRRCVDIHPMLIKSIMDIPVGTNRFSKLIMETPQIEKAYGVDYSEDMLAIARKKNADKFEFIKHNIFSCSLEYTVDIILCIRFLNLFNWEIANNAIRNISAMARKYFILSIRLVCKDYSNSRYIENKIFLHNDFDFYNTLQSLSLSIVSNYTYFSDTKPGTYNIFLLQKQNGKVDIKLPEY